MMPIAKNRKAARPRLGRAGVARELLCVLLLVAGATAGVAAGATGTAAALDYTHPSAGTGGPTEVAVSILMLDLEGVDSQQQSFQANVYVVAQWRDERLVHADDDPVVRVQDEVWTPNLQVLNQRFVTTTLPGVVRIESEGLVRWAQRYAGAFSQPLELRTFPFDTQELKVQIVPATGKPGEVSLVQSETLPSGVRDSLSVPDWRIVNYGTGSSRLVLAKGVEPIQIFALAMTAERRVGYYVVKVLVPLFLIVAMSWVVFWIDPRESGTQISVSITSMLTLIAYRFAVDSSLPKVSYLTSLDYFILAATVLVFISLLEVLLTARMAKSSERRLAQALRIDRVCRIAFPLAFAALAAETLFVRVLF